MARFANQHSAADLLKELERRGLATNSKLSDSIIALEKKHRQPFYAHVLIGVGTIISSFCLLVFLATLGIFSFLQNVFALSFWSLLIIAAALTVHKFAGDDNSIRQSLCMQSSFALMLTGKLLFVLGVVNAWNYELGLPVALTFVAAITYYTYPVQPERFLSSLAVLLSLLYSALWYGSVSDAQSWFFNGYFSLQFIAAAIILMRFNTKPDYMPIAYALVLALCFSALYVSMPAQFGGEGNSEAISPLFANSVLVGGLIATWVVSNQNRFKAKQLGLALGAAIVLAIISAPGVLLSIILLGLGYTKHDKYLTAIGVLFLPIFLWLYYYNLDVSLLQKSAILVGSGALLLIGGFYLKSKVPE